MVRLLQKVKSKNLTRKRGDAEKKPYLLSKTPWPQIKADQIGSVKTTKAFIYRDMQDEQDKNRKLAAYGFKTNKI
jgi:hypothetical protein